MARAGRGGPALATAATGSFVAALIATIGLLPRPGHRPGRDPVRALGLLRADADRLRDRLGDLRLLGPARPHLPRPRPWLGLVGIDRLTGQARLTFGVPELLDGIEVTTLAVGLFALGETLHIVSRHAMDHGRPMAARGSIGMWREGWRRSWKPWLRGAAIGFPIGGLPAGGAEGTTFRRYTVERKLASKPQEFGHGAIERVAGPEAANDASAAGTLVPLLTLGLPASVTAAVGLAGFQQHNTQPGPPLREPLRDRLGADREPLHRQRGAPRAGPAARGALGEAALDPVRWLCAGILVFAAMGTVAANPSVVDPIPLVVFGALGFLMRRYDYPIAPAVVGLNLGPMADSQLRRALQTSQGDPMILLQHPRSAAMTAIAALALVAPLLFAGLSRFAADED